MPSHTPLPAPVGQDIVPATDLLQDRDRCHPKRCPAELSVCLRPGHTSTTLHPCRSPPRNDREASHGRKSAALRLPTCGPVDWTRRRHSLDVRDDPSRWFEESNRAVANKQSGLFVDGWLPDPAQRAPLLSPNRRSTFLHQRDIPLRRRQCLCRAARLL